MGKTGWRWTANCPIWQATRSVAVAKRRRELHGDYLRLLNRAGSSELDDSTHGALEVAFENDLVSWHDGPVEYAMIEPCEERQGPPLGLRQAGEVAKHARALGEGFYQ